jgi:hypothetical protein
VRASTDPRLKAEDDDGEQEDDDGEQNAPPARLNLMLMRPDQAIRIITMARVMAGP